MLKINYSIRVLSLMCVGISLIVSTATTLVKRSPQSYTSITTKNVTEPSSYIEFKILGKPHHLFIGRCLPNHKTYHAENIIVHSDGKSHVSADIRINVEGPVYVSCVRILDQISNGEGGYPFYIAGGVGQNFVEFGITTEYGKGFHFFVEILGYEIADTKNKTST